MDGDIIQSYFLLVFYDKSLKGGGTFRAALEIRETNAVWIMLDKIIVLNNINEFSQSAIL